MRQFIELGEKATNEWLPDILALLNIKKEKGGIRNEKEA